MSMCKGGTESKLKDSHFMSHLPNLEPFRKETTKLGRILQESEREKKNCRNLGRTLQNLYLYIVRNQEEKLGTRSGIKLTFSPKSGSCTV